MDHLGRAKGFQEVRTFPRAACYHEKEVAGGGKQLRDSAEHLPTHAFYKTKPWALESENSEAQSQHQLARAVKLTRTSIVNIEAGRQKLLWRNPTRTTSLVLSSDLAIPRQSSA
jgi:hypothetical protein